MLVNRISKVIGVEDLDQALHFYGDALGLDVISRSSGWADLTCGDGHLALQPYRRPEDAGTVTPTGIIFTVTDLDEAIRAVEEAGARVIHRKVNDHARVDLAHVTDTVGNAIQLVQPL